MMYYLRTIVPAFVWLVFNWNRLDAQQWHQTVDYQIDVRLDEQANSIQARERVKYVNGSPDTLRSVYFRLAWYGRLPQTSSKFTVFSVQQNGIAIDFEVLESRVDPTLPPQSLSQSLLEVKLSRPLLPGESDNYNIAWQADIPSFSGGYGRNSPSGVDYTFTNWYPQACVYDRLGWHLGSPYEPDFSSEFGSFKVDITLPQKYMVAASGVLSNADVIGYGYEQSGAALKPNYGLATIWKFQAEQVRDFAWVADPELKHEKKQLDNGPVLHAFYFKNENQMAALESKLTDLEQKIMPYAFPQLSVVQVGEMRAEYPMLVFSGKEVPEFTPFISWDFQTKLLKYNYLLKQFRYATGDNAFKKGLSEIRSLYRFGNPPAAECIHLFERASGLELDWLWEQYSNARTQVDYAIGPVKTGDAGGTLLTLHRLKGAVLPVVLEITYTDDKIERYYIPVELLRAGLPSGSTAVQAPVWPSGAEKYTLSLGAQPIKSIRIDPDLLSGDVDTDNNRKDF